jgi:hypothetical protein
MTDDSVCRVHSIDVALAVCVVGCECTQTHSIHHVRVRTQVDGCPDIVPVISVTRTRMFDSVCSQTQHTYSQHTHNTHH